MVPRTTRSTRSTSARSSTACSPRPASSRLQQRRGESSWCGAAAKDRSYLFALNHTEAEVALAVSGRDLVADADTGGNLRLAPGGVAVVREDR